MSDIDQAALLEIISGKTRSNTAAAILSNTTDLENAYVDALHAEGSAYAENEKYLSSIQGKIDQFNNAVQTMWSNTLDDSVIKRFVSLGTEIVKLIDNLGLIKTLFIAIGTTYIYKNFGQDLFGDSFKKDNIDNVDNLNVKIDENGRAIQTAEDELQSYQTTTQTLGKTGQTTWNKITDGAKKAGKAIGKMAKSMLVMVAVTTVIELVASGIEFLADKIKNAKESAEEAQEKLEKFNSELSNCESELRNLESQLDNTQEKIEELVSQGPLSYIEQEELERLQAVSADFERQIAFRQTL